QLRRQVEKSDGEVDLKRMMSDLGKPDRQLQSQMPIGRSMTVTLSKTGFWLFRKTVGKLVAGCDSPQKELIASEGPPAVDEENLEHIVNDALRDWTSVNYPTTAVILSTSGFTPAARQWAKTRAEKNVIIVEPDEQGGWIVTGHSRFAEIMTLIDP